ncbi:RNA polymerase sigma factor RpoE [Gimesia alba]|uniref:RNA polymerase sigma factor RpoE n=1 Tax=Gimesia alba TaxID=2527973 RepID=A0A517RAB5_9PLAN|nr:sigma-70 family RNA polymerase sigma factor [Gimesia alba]QDT40723.1 RNA polymerase sigma factor RpoE [Gimesia alba]
MSNFIPALNHNSQGLFTSLLSKERLRIFGYIRALVPHNSDAEDIYQRVCLTLWKKFDEFDQERDFFFWACGIAFYTVCNYRRSIQHDRHFYSQELIETMSQKREQQLTNYNLRLELLHDCLNELPPEDRQLLQNVTLKNEPLKEMAKAANRSIQTLYNRLSLLRRELADCISRKLQSESQA